MRKWFYQIRHIKKRQLLEFIKNVKIIVVSAHKAGASTEDIINTLDNMITRIENEIYHV